MIMYQKSSPTGIDQFIDRCQVLMHRELPTIFGVNEATCLFYGRAEEKDDKFVVFTSGIDYVPVGIEDTYNFVSYFVPSDNFLADNLNENVDFSLYCHGNLANLFSSITHRADHELRSTMKSFVLRQIEPQDFINLEIINDHLQPLHSFKINFKIVF